MKTSKILSKALAMILCVVMVLQMMPLGVFADETDESTPEVFTEVPEGSEDTEDSEIEVYSEGSEDDPVEASYTVEHHLQTEDGYAIDEAATETKTGEVGAATAAAAKTYEGYTAKEIAQGTIAADGSTVVVICYDKIVPETVEASYTVEHYLQTEDGYAIDEAATETKTGEVGAATAAAAKEYEGYTANPFEQGVIAEDGSTVVKIEYSKDSEASEEKPAVDAMSDEELVEYVGALSDDELAAFVASLTQEQYQRIAALLGIETYDEDEYVRTYQTVTSTLAPGITQTVNSGYGRDGKLINYYISIADINSDDVGIHTSYKDAQCSVAGMAKMTEQAASLEALHSNPEDEANYIPYYAIVSGVNGDGYNTGSGKPSGVHIANGVVGFGTTKTANSSWFAIFEDGVALIGRNDADWDEAVADHGPAVEAIGGFQLVRKDGVDEPYTDSSYLNDGRYPRSFVGITADNKVVFMVADGNGSGGSVGTNWKESVEIMNDVGCTYILCLDGGGSATYISRPEGSNKVQVTSKPSDGSERAVSNGLVMYTTTPPSDVFAYANVSAAELYLAPGAQTEITAVGISPAGTAAEIPADAVWDVTGGTMEDGVFTAGETVGDAAIALKVGEETVGSVTVHVVLPDSISFGREKMTVPTGGAVDLELTAKYQELYTVKTTKDTFELVVADENIGTLDGWKFTASNSGAGTTTITATVKDTDPAVTATVAVTIGKASEVLMDFEAGTIGADMSNWRTAYMYENKVNLPDVSIVTSETGMVHSGDQALAFHYAMDEAIHGTEFWNGGLLIWQGDPVEIKNATKLGFWMYVPEDATQFSLWMNAFKHDENGKMIGQVASNMEDYNEDYVNNRDHSGWMYFEMPITAETVYLADHADQVNQYINGAQFKYKANAFLTVYQVNIDSWKGNETNYAGDFTFYIDDITIDYSDAVEDREKPIFSGMTYAVAGMSDAAALNGQTVTEKTVSFAGLVAEDTANPDNASGLNGASAVAYIDGKQVGCGYADGMITVPDVTLTDGTHTIRMGISDKMGNYAEIKRQITVNSGSDDASVRVRPQDSTLNYILNDAVYWIDVEADNVESIQSVEAKLDLDSMNNWVTDQIEVLHGFDCTTWYATGAEKAENILTVKFTRNSDYLAETGTAVLASLPIRVWEYYCSDDHQHKNAVEAWKCNYVCAPALSIDVDTEMGVVSYKDGTSHSFSSTDIHTLGVSYTYGVYLRDKVSTFYNSHSFHVHAEQAIADKTATCTENGYTGRTWCDTCNSPVAWGTTLKATGHTFAITDGVLKCACGQTFTGTWTDGKDYADGVCADGWVGDSYYQNGEKLTGIQVIDGYYYDFGEDGICAGQTKFSGLFYDESISAYRYAVLGELTSGWHQIDGNWHYFWKYNMQAATGEVKLPANGVTYQFDETGMTKGAWHTTEAGTRYYFSDEFYRARQEGYQTFFEIDGKTYNFDGKGYVTYGQYRALQPAAFIMERNVFEFNEDGTLKGSYTTPGPIDCADGETYFIHEDGKAYMDAGLVEHEGDYYFVVYSGKLAKNQNRTITADNANGLMDPGVYYFGADGKMVIEDAFTGVTQDEDGVYKYFIEGKVAKDLGCLVSYNGYHYYVKPSGKIAINEYRILTAGMIGEFDFEPGIYHFDSEGRLMLPFTGVKEKDGTLYYFVDGQIAEGQPGVVEYEGNYYEVKFSGKVAVNENRNLTAEKIGSLDITPGIYYFDSEGKLQMPFTGVKADETGILYYYVNNKILKNQPGVVEYEGAYYDVKASGKVAVNEKRNLTAEKIGSLDIVPGIYYFDSEGKMQMPFTGVKEQDGVLYYFVDSVIAEGQPGLIEYEGNYYEVKYSGKVAVNEKRNLTAEKIGSLDVAPGIYYFDSEGKLQLPFTGVKADESGTLYYYVDGLIKTGVQSLVNVDGAIYYVKWSGKVAVNENRNITDANSNGLLAAGMYFFGADGKLVTQ